MYLNCKPPGGPRQFQLRVRRPVRGGPRAPADLRADRQRQQQLPHHLHRRPRPRRARSAATTTTRCTTAASVGKWEGDTLVVDTRGFNEDFWFTNGGLPHTDQLRLIERFSRPDFDTLKYEVTVEDPGAYTRRGRAVRRSAGWRAKRCRGTCARTTDRDRSVT